MCCLMLFVLKLMMQTEQEYSAQQSALVNNAYSTLSKPYSRGLYLVSSSTYVSCDVCPYYGALLHSWDKFGG